MINNTENLIAKITKIVHDQTGLTGKELKAVIMHEMKEIKKEMDKLKAA